MSEYLDRLADGRDAIIEAVRAGDGVAGIKAFAAYERIVEAEVRRAATTDEPGLRDTLEDALTFLENIGGITGYERERQRLLTQIGHVLAATPVASDGSLDVERLARALEPGHDFVHDGGLDDCQFADEDAAIEAATRIAATYARLSESPSEGKTK